MKSVEENHAMKVRYSFIFLIIIVFSNTSVMKSSTDSTKASLQIEITNKRATYFGIPSFLYDSIIVLKNNKPFRTLNGTDHTLSSLDTGLYTIHYSSIYKKEDSKTIYISNYKPYSITICADSLDYKKETYIPIIDQLREKESYTIAMQTSGCFYFESDILTIQRRKGRYYAIWQSDGPTFSSHSSYLTRKQIETIRKFELELNYMNNSYLATTKDTFTISFRESSKTFVDGSWTWFGYLHFREKMKNK